MKEIYVQSLKPTSGLDSMYSFFLLSLLLHSHYHVFLFPTLKKILSRVQASSPRHRCGGSVIAPPPLLLLSSWRSLSWSLKRDTLILGILLFHFASDNVQRLFQPYHPHVRVYVKEKLESDDLKHGGYCQSDEILAIMQSPLPFV